MVIWKHKSTRDSDFAEFTVGKFTVVVEDCDGDMSIWSILNNTSVVCGNKEYGLNPYHFEAAKEAAIKALIPLATAEGLYKE